MSVSKNYLISCEVIRYEIEFLLPQIANPPEILYIRKGYHDYPDELRRETQKAIDAVPDTYERIILGYGLCGKGTEGVCARNIPIVTPRIHDCISLLLGSAKAYGEHFKANPGSFYFSPGWVDMGWDSVGRAPSQGAGLGKTYEEYVEKYGEENAKYLMELEGTWAQRYTRACYVDCGIPDTGNWECQARKYAEDNNWTFEQIPGSLCYFRLLLEGPWNEEDFLIIPPGAKIMAVNDEKIITAVMNDK